MRVVGAVSDEAVADLRSQIEAVDPLACRWGVRWESDGSLTLTWRSGSAELCRWVEARLHVPVIASRPLSLWARYQLRETVETPWDALPVPTTGPAPHWTVGEALEAYREATSPGWD